MSDNNGSLKPDLGEALSDGVIVNAALRNLSDSLNKEVEEERLLNGPLSMVCTYPEGYKDRQSLYACLTCQQETGQLSGICFACAENCHDDHEMIQLYTKRNFCCDCGNSKFKTKCKLFEEKSAVNRKNKYNHNFKGEYCTCNLPYPAPEGDPMGDVEMVQCTMCEDWYHPPHLEVEKLGCEDFSEMVCPGCSVKFPFLIPYHFVYEQDRQRDETDLDATTANADTSALDTTTASTSAQPVEPPNTPKHVPIDNTGTENQTECYYEKIKSIVPTELSEPPLALVFYEIDFRPMLCRCVKCKRMYEDLECEFLLDENDPVGVYMQKNASELEKNHRDAQTELFDEVALRTNAEVAHNVVTEVASFKQQLHSFIKEASQTKDEVTEEDVHTFFAQLNAKRRRLNGPGE